MYLACGDFSILNDLEYWNIRILSGQSECVMVHHGQRKGTTWRKISLESDPMIVWETFIYPKRCRLQKTRIRIYIKRSLIMNNVAMIILMLKCFLISMLV